MRKYSIMNKDRLATVLCNKCGKNLKMQGDIVTEGAFMVDYAWNYFSDKDGDIHKFDLCEGCYNEMIQQFNIPVDIEKRVELM